MLSTPLRPSNLNLANLAHKTIHPLRPSSGSAHFTAQMPETALSKMPVLEDLLKKLHISLQHPIRELAVLNKTGLGINSNTEGDKLALRALLKQFPETFRQLPGADDKFALEGVFLKDGTLHPKPVILTLGLINPIKAFGPPSETRLP